MGIKTLKNIFLGFVIVLLIFTSPRIFAQDSKQQGNKLVRVAIGNQNFQTYNYQKITVFGTSDVQIFNKLTKSLIAEIPADTMIEISITDNCFQIKRLKDELINDVTETQSDAIKTKNDFVIECKEGLLGIKDLKRKGKQALYHSNFEIIKKPKTDNLFYLVNVLDIQDYLKGVVPNEMPTSFGLEALKAQAVAARNYVLSPRTRLVNEYDVVDSVASQVYFGANTEEAISNKA